MRTLLTLLAIGMTMSTSAQKYAIEVGAFAVAPQKGYFDKLPGTYETIDVNFIFRYYKDAPSKSAAEKILLEAKSLGFANARLVDFDNLKQQCNITCEYIPPTRTGVVSEQIKVEELYPIFFDFDKYNLTPQARTELDKYVSYLKRNRSHELQIYAHTDAKGAVNYNEELSRDRARTATAYLVSRGIASSRIQAKPLGEKEPIAKNNDADGHDLVLGRQLNRRIEFRITDSEGRILRVTNKIKVPDYLK